VATRTIRSPAFSSRPLRGLCRARARQGPLTWCLEDFLWFASRLTMPEGGPLVLEPHLLLLAWEVFRRVGGSPAALPVRPFRQIAGGDEEWLRELLCLLPKGNGKTAFFAALAVFHLLTVRNANCYIGAADGRQAQEMYRFALHYVESQPALLRLLKPGKSTKVIKSRRDNGFVEVLASDDSTIGNKKQGYNPTLALVDELHAHDNDNLYADLRSGLFKRDGLIVTITTAGADADESILGQLRARMLAYGDDGNGELVSGLRFDGDGELVYDPMAGRLTVARSPSGQSVLVEWALRDRDHPRGADDPGDFAIAKLANPASWVTIASLRDAFESLSFARYCRWRCNLWAQADDAKIPAEAWDALNTGAGIDDDAAVWAIVDYARKSDASAVVQLWRRDDGKVIPEAHVWALEDRRQGRAQPACHTLVKGERTIRQSLIRKHIRELRDGGRQVLGVIYDPHLFDPEELSDEGFQMIEFPQTDKHMVPASKAMFEAICGGNAEDGEPPVMEHDGDRVLRSHVINAGTKDKGDGGYRFSKAASKQRIDALIGMTMGIETALKPVTTGGFEW
jgi:phage terminase large subunit-like protein